VQVALLLAVLKGKVKVTLEETMKAHRSVEVQLTLSLTSALNGVSGESHASAALPPVKRPVAHCIGVWVGPGPVWTGEENISSTGIRSPDRPSRSQSLF